MNCQIVSIKDIWEDKIKFTIPDIQRGLVWNSAQMEVFWDSLLRGIPIGVFTVAKINGEKILLDGQQRLNAIKAAIDTESGVLWCCILDQNHGINIYNRRYLFRWATAIHPWGWKIDANEKSSPRLSIDERRSVLDGNNLSEKDLFKKPKVGEIKPYPHKRNDDKIKMVKFTDLLKNSNAPSDFNSGEAKKYYDDLRNKLLEIIEQPLIPILGQFDSNHSDVSNYSITEKSEDNNIVDAEWLDMFFRRMNSQGTPFSGEELAYSALKSALYEIGIEKPREYFENISKNFSNTAQIAQTVLQLITHIEYQKEINKSWDANEIKIFFKDKKEDAEKLNDHLRDIKILFERLEIYRCKFNKTEEKVEILPYHLTILLPEILKTALIILKYYDNVDVKLFWGILFGIYFFHKANRTNGDKNCPSLIAGKIIAALEKSNSQSYNDILKKSFAECIYEGWLIPPADEDILKQITVANVKAGKFYNNKEMNILIESRLGRTFKWDESFTFVTLACGKYLSREFGSAVNLNEDNRPWDYDHCFPKDKLKPETEKMCLSSGNNVPIALTTNRSKQNKLPDENYPDKTPESQNLLYLDHTKLALFENSEIFNEFAVARFKAMYNEIFNAFCWQVLLAELPKKNNDFKEKAWNIQNKLGNNCKWYYVMNDLEFPVNSEKDFLRYKWFSLRNSPELSHAIVTCDFKNFECVKRKATWNVLGYGVPWNEEYHGTNGQEEAIEYLRKKWNLGGDQK